MSMDSVTRIKRAHKDVCCTRGSMRLCSAQRPELCSIVARLARDLGLDPIDFESFDVKVWRAAKERLQRHLALTPYIVMVA